jgi:mRNA interferase YafQ
MFRLTVSHQFRKDLRAVKKRGLEIRQLKSIIILLQNGEALPERNKDHQLSGQYFQFRECHIQPDWLLIYAVSADGELYLFRTGSHSDLF